MLAERQKTLHIIELLEQATSLDVVREFLKSKGLRHSAGSWDDLREKRLLPAIDGGEIVNADLIALLTSAEECGKQHVFLYFCDPARAVAMIDRGRVNAALKHAKLAHLLTEPDILVKPESPTIVDVRWETANVDTALIIKEVEVRTHRRFLRDEIIGDNFHRVYTNQVQRAVNLARLHRNGALEVRIAAHANSSKYEGDVLRFFRQIQNFISLFDFSEVSLTKAKDTLWAKRASIGALISYTDASVTDKAGNVLRAVAGSDKSDLSNDKAIGESIDHLMNQDKHAYCSDANLWFNKSAQLTSNIHVLFNGEANEFALPANCSQGDYEYVLNQIKFFNK
ncbi:hypothetical protein [Janthinobacterium sp. MDB2-8]|uniref:hypothetical protein n=1 Tax=Janthinobacterium sp. MDB2-8 TaxID=1259338 RepID=UPI003F29A96C